MHASTYYVNNYSHIVILLQNYGDSSQSLHFILSTQNVAFCSSILSSLKKKAVSSFPHIGAHTDFPLVHMWPSRWF